jgi:hypothetical protein
VSVGQRWRALTDRNTARERSLALTPSPPAQEVVGSSDGARTVHGNLGPAIMFASFASAHSRSVASKTVFTCNSYLYDADAAALSGLIVMVIGTLICVSGNPLGLVVVAAGVGLLCWALMCLVRYGICVITQGGQIEPYPNAGGPGHPVGAAFQHGQLNSVWQRTAQLRQL